MSDSAATTVAALEGDPEPGAAQVRLVPLTCETQPVALELGRPRLVAQAEVREAEEEQVARIPHARRGEVRGDRSPRAIRLGSERLPVSERVRQLELEGDGMDAVVRREALREAGVKLGQAPRLVEAADGGSRRRARLVGLAQVIRIVDPGKQREPLIAPGRRLLEAPLVEGASAFAHRARTSGAPGCRATPRAWRPPRERPPEHRAARRWPAREAPAPSPRSRPPPAPAPSTPTPR